MLYIISLSIDIKIKIKIYIKITYIMSDHYFEIFVQINFEKNNGLNNIIL